MKISLIPVSFFEDIVSGNMTVGEWARIGKDVGLDGIDMSINFIKNHNPVYLGEIKKELSDAGIPLIMITAYPDFTHPDQLQREREFEYLKHDIALSSELGARYLRVLAGQAHPEMDVERGAELAIRYLRDSVPVAEKFGVKLLYENHSKPGSWYYTDISGPSDVFLKVVEGIYDTDIRINFDTANSIAVGEEPIPLLKKVIDKVETVHAADTSTKGRLNHVLLGTGLVPFKEIFSILKESGFDGWISIEENSRMGIGGINKSIRFIRKTWKEA
jgi:sugar phosphate isomerase/epimerase